MHELMELKEKLIKELEDYAQNGKYSKEDVETIKYMASAVDHLCNIISEADETGYSNRDGNTYTGNQGGNRSYARGRGRYARRDSMGRYSTGRMYSRTDGIEELVDNVREMMQDLPPDVQQDAQKFVRKLEQEMA